MLKKIITSTIITATMFASSSANTLLDNYRNNGINAIEKQLDLELSDKKYWKSFLKDKDTTFGYSEVYSSILTCDKSKSMLTLYQINKKNTYIQRKDYDAFVGKEKGDKKTEGDLKTPIGIYNLVERLDNVDSFYGPLAFVTSYPNDYDLYKGKDGHGIWIHGVPTNQDRDSFTKGCIAIGNKGIECLSKHIDISKTILIINKEETKKNISKEILASILSNLYKWRYAWIYNDFNSYINFYSKNFVRNDKLNFENFKNYKTRIFSKNESKTIIFKDISLFPYPNTKNRYQITFTELYKSSSFEFTGAKTLIVELDEQNNMLILTEK